MEKREALQKMSAKAAVIKFVFRRLKDAQDCGDQKRISKLQEYIKREMNEINCIRSQHFSKQRTLYTVFSGNDRLRAYKH